MQDKIVYIERVLEFYFEGGFKEMVAINGATENDIGVWFKNAQVFSLATLGAHLSDDEKIALLTLIEAVRFEITCSKQFGAKPKFDMSGYDFSNEFVRLWLDKIIILVQRQVD